VSLLSTVSAPAPTSTEEITMSPFLEARMYLGIDLRAALGPDVLADPAHHSGLVRAAARRGLDFVALAGRDAVTTATAVASTVPGIGLIPTVGSTDSSTDDAALAALDTVSGGRAGREYATGAPGRSDGPLVVLRADGPASLPLIGEHADVVRVAAPGLDAAHSVVEQVRAAVAAAGRDPHDVVVLLDVEVSFDDQRGRAARRLAAPPSTLRVTGSVGDLAALVGSTVRLGVADGITFVPLDPASDVRRICDDLVPVLAGRGLFRPGRAGTLRTRFGFAPATAAAVPA
jgi:alkanesulfonate monooxygenase SsuD/methylene tetrahydromethanopterin reductase-like flavin-dependent oxidoreductase (luciferase family)